MNRLKLHEFFNFLRWVLATALIVLAWGLGTVGISNASGRYYSDRSSPGYELYAEECGACHFAYPARMLPADSWQVMLSSLDNHFGENAELIPEAQQEIGQYLTGNAGKPGRGMLKRVKEKAPQRISELPYFIHEHDELPSRYVAGNSEVGSFSNCNACHQKAEKGNFDEDSVRIPGYGRWDD